MNDEVDFLAQTQSVISDRERGNSVFWSFSFSLFAERPWVVLPLCIRPSCATAVRMGAISTQILYDVMQGKSIKAYVIFTSYSRPDRLRCASAAVQTSWTHSYSECRRHCDWSRSTRDSLTSLLSTGDPLSRRDLIIVPNMSRKSEIVCQALDSVLVIPSSAQSVSRMLVVQQGVR
jgi:hypothetical protein